MSLKIDKGLAYLLVYSLASNEDAIDYDKSLVIKVFEKFGIDKSFILRGKKAKNIGKKILRDSQKATTDTQNHLLCKKCGFDIAGRF